MARRGYIPTAQELEQLYKAASEGDADAVRELGDLNNKIAKRANERMRDIERKGLEGTAAYDRAAYYIQNQDFGDKKHFSQSRKLDIDDLVMNIENASSYLRSQTSTAAGEMKRRSNILDTLSDRGYIQLPVDRTSQADFEKKFLQFLDSNAWADIKKHMYATGSGMLGDAAEAIQNGANVNDLIRSFKDYQKGSETDLFEIWDNWQSGDSYYRSGEWHTLKRPRK